MNKNKKLVFVSIYCALALVLDYVKSFIPFLNMPSGGSINIALIPIVICSFHMGVLYAMGTGLLWWFVSSLLGLNPYYISFIQYVVDYILPSVIVGISSIFYSKRKIYEIEVGISLMMLLRTFILVLSGAIFWPDGIASNSIAAWEASLMYNLPYSIGTYVMLLVVIPVALRNLKKYVL